MQPAVPDHRPRPLLIRLLVAAGLFAAALGARLVFFPLADGPLFLTFFPAMTMTFMLCGIGPGIGVTGLSAVVVYCFLVPAGGSAAGSLAGLSGVTLAGMPGVTLSAGTMFLAAAIPVGLLVRNLAATRAELALLASRQTSILASEMFGIATIRDRRIVWANRGLEALLGYGPGELAGVATRMGFPSEAAYDDVGGGAYGTIRDGGTYHGETLMVRRDGTEIWLSVAGSLLDAGGDMSLWLCTDIDQHKRAEAALRASEDLLERTNALAGVGGWELDVATMRLSWADETCRLHGVPAGTHPTLEEAIGFYTPAARQAMELAVRAGMAEGKPWDLELELMSATGRHFWARAVGLPEFRDGAVVRLTGAIQDITTRRLAELALQDSEERLRLALDAGKIGVWDSDMTSATSRYDASASMMFDHVFPADVALRWDGREHAEWIGRIDPAYREAHLQQLRSFIAGGMNELSIAYPARRADGTTIWLSFRGVVRDRHPVTGLPSSALGVVMDITSQEEATIYLREQEQTARRQAVLLKTIHSAARAGLCFVDRDLRIREINGAMAELFGGSVAACLGRTGHELGHVTAVKMAALLQQVLDTGTPVEGYEFSAAPSGVSGGERSWLMSVHPVLDGAGAVIGVGQAVVEITVQKQTERALRDAKAALEAIAHVDALTGLANRRRFDETLNRECAIGARTGAPLSLVLLDVDRFKLYNDLYGHPEGDECLRAVALALRSVCQRAADLPARHGGEEFALILPATDAPGAAIVAEAARHAIQALARRHQGNAPCGGIVTASFGVATIDRQDDGFAYDRDNLVAAADKALYEAKQAGRDRVVAPAGTRSKAAGRAPPPAVQTAENSC